MSIAAAMSIVLLAVAPLAKDWQHQLSPAQPGPFPPLRPLHANYKFGWGVLAAGEAEVVYAPTNTGLMRLDLKGRTTGWVRELWRFDTTGCALCQPETLRPVNVSKTEVGRSATVRTLLDFDATGVTRRRSTANGDGMKTKRCDFPNLFDLPTSLLWLRSQRLQPGDLYRCLVFPDMSAYLAEMQVLGKETTSVAGKQLNAIKVGLHLLKVNRAQELEPHRKFTQAVAWLSDDSDRLLVKVSADVFVGSVWMELDKVEFRGGSN